ncbi:MAG: Nif3-like dinuclear metal center hexameric protein [Brotaphodocola sp.]
MLCKDVIKELEKLAPSSYACDWDNPGLLAGRTEKQVRKILIALDATTEVIKQAAREGVDMVVTHHPLVFRALKKVNDQNFISRRIVKLIQADISCFAMHTNFDCAPGCMADLAAERIHLQDGQPLEVTGDADGVPIGIGKIGTLKEPMSVRDLASFVKTAFGLPFVLVYGERQVEERVSRVAISPGSGGSMIEHGLAAGAEVLITGDIGHHDGQDAAENHMAVIDAGHYGLEHIFISFIRTYLEEKFGSDVIILEAEEAFPTQVI